MPHFHSLRSRLILPLLLAAIVAASLVAGVSYWLAERATGAQLDQRFAAIRQSLAGGQFPLTRNVLMSLAELTSAQWITLGPDGRIVESTLGPLTPGERQRLARRLEQLQRGAASRAAAPLRFQQGQRVYRLERFVRAPAGGRGGDASVQAVVVLFDDAQWQAIRLRAAAAPLVSGLSTIVLLSSVTLLLTGRLVRRIARLQSEVEAIAGGNFTSDLQVGPNDEIGRLGMAVQTMAEQLRQMWEALRHQHGQRLLHQVAAGLAHNLRNSLTGARMAVELHTQRCPAAAAGGGADEGLSVAITQLEQTEDYIRRLLIVASGKQQAHRAASLGQCLRDVRESLGNTARHRGVALSWEIDAAAAGMQVADGPTLTAAVTNLLWNAIQASERVQVQARWLEPEQRVQIEVIDSGPGPPPELADTLFEPFVTSRPEGLGLGLPLVARSAEFLGGTVQWHRRSDQTVFCLHIPAAS